MYDEETLQRMMDSLITAYIEADWADLAFRASWRPKLSTKPRLVSRRRQFTRPIEAHHQRI